MERRRKTPSTSQPPPSPAKLDRKTAEKNRRNRMTLLLQNLFSLIPPQHSQPNSKAQVGLPEQLEQATAYVERLRERVERLRDRKEEATRGTDADINEDGLRLPVLKVTDLKGTAVQVTLVTTKAVAVAVAEVVKVLEEEGTEVVGINIATVGDRVFHTLSAQVKIERIGVDASRIARRIYDLLI